MHTSYVEKLKRSDSQASLFFVACHISITYSIVCVVNKLRHTVKCKNLVIEFQNMPLCYDHLRGDLYSG